MEEALEQAKKALERDDASEIKAASEALTQASHKMAEAMYGAAGAAGAAAAAAGAPGAAPGAVPGSDGGAPPPDAAAANHDGVIVVSHEILPSATYDYAQNSGKTAHTIGVDSLGPGSRTEALSCS